ncbi:MAG: hypothetical protein COS42_03570 [Flavobacteriales bacterium CG03_land_8_20_14_0_80_35_15]|nr:MAG: hypothetical protein COS42_03570 [Flavobacteriales bacterium CG03_land_8_20_14_0_80_35_15]
MKKILIIIIAVFTIISCSKESKKESAKNEITNFLNLFDTLKSDSLKIESLDSFVDSTMFDFKGKLIDTSYFHFINDKTIKLALQNDDNYYACYKKSLNDSILLLIMRTPNEYWENSIKFYLFDLKKSQTIDYLEVAQKWSDAGDYSEKYSIFNKNLIITYTKDCMLTNEEKNETICNDSIYNFEIGNDKFILKRSEKSSK